MSRNKYQQDEIGQMRKCHGVQNMLWERIFVKEFHGSIESGRAKRNASQKTEEPGMALPVELPCFPSDINMTGQGGK